MIQPAYSSWLGRLAAWGRVCPAAAVALGMAAGIYAAWLWEPGGVGGGAAVVFLSAAVLGAAAFGFRGRQLGAFVVAAALAAPILWLNWHWRERQVAELLPRQRYGVEAWARIVDPSCVGAEIEWMPNPRLARCELLAYRHSPLDEWRPIEAVVAARLPRSAPRVAYGETLLLRGAIIDPDTAMLPGEFDFAGYLGVKGFSRLFQVFAVGGTAEGEPPPTAVQPPRIAVMAALLRGRDKLLAVLADGIGDPGRRRTLAALFFGCRQGLESSDRAAYAESGTIHLFAISGLHVGMLALMLMWLGRPLPFRWRHAMLPPLLLLYVATIGFQPSAARAWLMISIWCGFRVLFMATNPLNVVFFAAATILLVRPFSLFDAGFQYSFVVTGFLVHAWSGVGDWVASLNERSHWVPARLFGWRDTLRYGGIERLAQAVAATLVACLSSGTLNLGHRGFFPVAAVGANLLLAPMVYLLFLMAMLKIIIGLANRWLGALLAMPLESGMALVSGIAIGGSRLMPPIFLRPPPLWSAALALVAMAALFSRCRRPVTVAAMLSLVALAAYWHTRSATPRPLVTIIHGGESQEPCVIIIPGGSPDVFVVNAPSPEASRAATNYLSSIGGRRIDLLYLSAVRKEHVAGAARLMALTDVGVMALPDGYRRGQYAKAAVAAAPSAGTLLDFAATSENKRLADHRYGSWPFAAVADGESVSIEVNTANVRGLSVIVTNDGMGGRTALVEYQGQKCQIILENRNRISLETISF